jgi:translation initiation factor IF-1
MVSNKRDRLEFEGEVVEENKGKFLVKVTETHSVRCTLAGKVRQNQVHILPGDKVKIEVSLYDTTQGRITFRMKK